MLIISLKLNKSEVISYINELTTAYEKYGFGNYKGRVTASSAIMEADQMDVFFEQQEQSDYLSFTRLDHRETGRSRISFQALYMLFTYMVGSDVLRERIGVIDKQEVFKLMQSDPILHFSLEKSDGYWTLKIQTHTNMDS